MTIFSGKMSSDSDDWSLLAPSETNLKELSKRSRIRYTREFLVSLADLSIGKGLLKGIAPSILSELDFLLEEPQQNSYESDSESSQDNLDNGLPRNSENDGLLGPGSSLGFNGGAAGTSPPKVSQTRVDETSLSILHKCKEPYRPPRLFKADWNDIKDKMRMPSPELTSQKREKQNWRRDVPDVMREEQKKDKPKNYSIDNHKNIENVMPLEVSKIDEITNSLQSEHSDYYGNHTKSPATCYFESAHQFPDVEEKPACVLSCTKGSENLAQGAPNEHFSKVPDQHRKSDSDDTFEQSYGCQIPDFILGVLACVGLEHILKPGTTEITSSMLGEGSDAEDSMQHSADKHGAQQFHFLPGKGTEQNNMVEYSKPNISSEKQELKSLSQGNARHLEKDPTEVPSCGASSRKEFQSVDAYSCFRQSPVGRSTRKSVCKFFFPVVNMNPLPATSKKYKPSEIISEAGKSKGGKDHSFSDELNPNPDSYFDEKDSFPLDICLPDEDSLITVDDFRIVTYKDMLERNEAKADRVNPSPPVNTSMKTADSNISKSELGNTSHPHQQAQTNFPVNSIKPKFQPQRPSNRPYSMPPNSFHQSQAKPQQQLQHPLHTETVPTCYMQQFYQVQAFPWTYQTSSYANVAVPTPALQTYGGNTLYGTQSNARTGYYGNWQ